MTQPDVDEFVNQRGKKFRWDLFLPKRKAWLQTLILLPFGLPIANFLVGSWQFSANAIVEEHQYILGTLSMAINLCLPTLFLAFVFHWGWFVWQQTEVKTWYPTAPAFKAGAYAILTIALSFGAVGLFAHSFGICNNSAWGAIGSQLICNLNGYGFESKSWFGLWFIIAAYCYQAQSTVYTTPRRFRRRHRDFTANSAIGQPLPHNIDSIASNSEE